MRLSRPGRSLLRSESVILLVDSLYAEDREAALPIVLLLRVHLRCQGDVYSAVASQRQPFFFWFHYSDALAVMLQHV
jgi:hypothetical protein